MPDDHASSSDPPRRDETSATTGAPHPLHGEPPTLPPFSTGDGPRPLTIAGMPAIDVFAGAEDLFADVPSLGPRVASGPTPMPDLPIAPITKVGPAPLPPAPKIAAPPKLGAAKLAGPPKLSSPPKLGGAEPTLGSVKGPPPSPSRSDTNASASPTPASKPDTVRMAAPAKPAQPVKTESVKTEPVKTESVKTESVKTEPVKTEPAKPSSAAGISDLAQAIALSPDLEFELSVGLLDPAEVIRKAREKALQTEASAPVERTDTPGPIAIVVAGAMPLVESSPARESGEPTPEPSEPSQVPESGNAEQSLDVEALVEAASLARDDANSRDDANYLDNLVTAPFPSLASLAARNDPTPNEIVDDRESSPPRAMRASEPLERATLEPVIIHAPLGRATAPVASDEPAITPTRGSIASDSDDSGGQSRDHAALDNSLESLANAESNDSADPSQLDQDTSSSEDGSMSNKALKPLAPPAPRSVVDEDRPRIGVPYEPPAVVVRLSEVEASEPELAHEREDTGVRGHAALPKPGRATIPARAPMPSSDPGKVVPLPLHARAEGAPHAIAKEDTGALIDGMADEIVAQARRERVQTQIVATLPAPKPTTDNRRTRKLVIGFSIFALAASLLVALLPDSSEDTIAEDDAAEPEPLPTALPESEPKPDLIAQADPAPEPIAAPDPPSEEPLAEPEPEPEPTVEAPKPEKSTKPKTKAEPKPEPVVATKPKPEPKPEPKPAAKPEPVDNRNGKQLYDAAKSAYDKGKASEAYKLALASYRKEPKPKTAELMLLAACKLGDSTKAKSAIDKVSGVRKPAMRKQCKGMGVTI